VTQTATPAAAPANPRVGLLLASAILIGLLASVLGVAFVVTEHELTHILWDKLPEALGQESAPGWLVYVLLLTGGALVYLARKLPGDGGHEPLHGMSLDITPKQITSVVLAALASLAFGAVVGPEAPLMAIGTATGAAVAARRDPSQTQILMLAGAMAAMGMIFGNPLVTSILLLEVAALKGGRGGKAAMLTMLPVLLALGFGYIVQVGVGQWGGFGQSVLAVPGLPEYPTTRFIDLAMSLPVGLVVGLLVVIALQLGHKYHAVARTRLLAGLLMAGAIVATAAVSVRAITGGSINLILFSGQSSIPEVLQIGSASSLLLLVICKGIAYGVSVGGGFRGGLIFPAVDLGVITGVTTALLVSGTSQSPLVAAGIGAGAGAALRAPFTSTLLAVLLCGDAGGAVTSSAIIGAVAGVLVRAAVDMRLEARGGVTDEAVAQPEPESATPKSP
jgi:H+/Cl- antiporter ClcA